MLVLDAYHPLSNAHARASSYSSGHYVSHRLTLSSRPFGDGQCHPYAAIIHFLVQWDGAEHGPRMGSLFVLYSLNTASSLMANG